MILAWLGAAFVGLSLGLLGSGGSILTVPILLYLADQHGKVAIAESLAIVGTIALAGGIPPAFKRLTRWSYVLLFGLPGMAGSYVGAVLARFIPVAVQLVLFAAIMLTAGILMLRPRQASSEGDKAWWMVGGYGLGVGIITGLVGVGGGFLIVPALTFLGGLPIHHAIATSLWIIALNAGMGFFKYLNVLHHLGLQLHGNIILVFSLIGIAGSFAGHTIGARIPQVVLRRYFAYFLFVMGAFILLENLPQVF